MKFKIALLQVLPANNDQEENLEKGIRCCREAKARGADLVVFPELWNIGCAECPAGAQGMQAWEASAVDQDSQFVSSFRNLARELDLNIAITYLEKHSPKPRNSVSIINRRGEI